MSRHRRLETLLAMKKVGIIPVFYNSNFEIARDVICACADGGANVIEFTNRGDRAIDTFKELCIFRDEQRPELVLGVGSICDAPTAAMYISAGADFIVGPLLDEEVAKLCNSRKIPYSPGCGSLTEIHKAEILGVEICKVFPGAQVGGPGFVKAVKGPCPWTDIMPTGGVSPTRESLTEWFNAGICCAGIGSNLVTKEILKSKDYKKLTEDVKATLALVNEIRGVK